MKKWKKANAILLSAVLAAATLLGGCGGSDDSGTSNPAPADETAPADESATTESAEEAQGGG